MSDDKLTRLEEELLADLFAVERAFKAGRLGHATIESRVLYLMAHRRGKTRPAPVKGLHQADRTFKGTFTRTLNRLLSRKLLERRPVGDDFSGLPYQWGFARHGKRDKDLFLTAAGRAAILGVRPDLAKKGPPELPPEVATDEELGDNVIPLPLPKPPAPVDEKGLRPARPSPRPTPGPGLVEGPQGQRIQYVYAPPKPPLKHVTYRHTVRMGPMTVTYLYVKEGLPPMPPMPFLRKPPTKKS